VGALKDLVVHPVFNDMIPSTNAHKNPTKRYHFILCLALLEVAEDGFGKSSYQKGEYLLKGYHMNLLASN
jgi:hypothetical protein